jgi:hypothetical protein
MLSRFLGSTTGLIPYAGAGASVSLVVGGQHGGGFEWRLTQAARGLGVVALAVDASTGLVTDIDAMWNGAFATDKSLLSIARAPIER